jgi:hypothetical protein
MIQSRNWQPKPSSFSQRKQRVILSLVLAIFLAVLLYIEYIGTVDTSVHKTSTSSGSTKILPPLSNEKRFFDTFRSCLSPQKCFQHVPDGSQVQRIAILSPPGTLFNDFVDILKKALLAHYSNSMEEMNAAIKLLPSSHVPPYGYGKNHGLTKIIRVHSSLITQVMDTLQFQKQQQRQPKALENLANDASQTMRQVIRWHCRLSHVAAHTALLNVDLSALHVKELERVVNFIVAKPGDEPLPLTEEGTDPVTLFPDFSFLNNLHVDEDIRRWFQSNIGRSEMDHIVLDELDTTNNLSLWPCLSFWRKGTGTATNGERIDASIHEQLAQMMAPKCSEPFVKCSVKFDRCEEKGDIPCR